LTPLKLDPGIPDNSECAEEAQAITNKVLSASRAAIRSMSNDSVAAKRLFTSLPGAFTESTRLPGLSHLAQSLCPDRYLPPKNYDGEGELLSTKKPA
jgi:hypothetical protein